MDRVLNVSTATAGAGNSATLDLGDMANASGDKGRVLRLDRSLGFISGTFSSVLVEESADAVTWATLWNLGTFTGADYQYLYTWKRYLRISWSYAVGSTTEDVGGRFRVRARVFGLPDWERAKICRWDHCKGIRPSWFEYADGFPDSYPSQHDAAKLRVETMLKGAGQDPQKLFTDGHPTEPVPIGLANAGAFAVLLMVHQDAGFPKGEAWQQEHELLESDFRSAFELAVASGLMLIDDDTQSADDEDVSYTVPRLGR